MKKIVVLQILLLSVTCAISQDNLSTKKVSANQTLEGGEPSAKLARNSAWLERKRYARAASRDGKAYHARPRRPMQALQRIRRPIRISR